MSSTHRLPEECSPFQSSFARAMAEEERPQIGLVKPTQRRPSIQYESIRRISPDKICWKQKDCEGTNGWSSGGSADESKDDEILRLRKECQGLMESNRKLHQNGPSLDSSLLQSQVDTLQWQLKQAESNRQMYRAVMEQVSKFLERVHKTLESSVKNPGGCRAKHRVPRSRSVHTVVTGGTLQSRASSPSPSPASVHRANSISQIQDSYSTWRCARPIVEEVVSPERLSQEAFRLLRTIQSLLNTREPDLARLTDSESSQDRRDSTSMGSCSSLLQNGVDSKQGGPSTPQLSVGSTEDESGFSSMSSFHEGGQSEAPRSDFVERVEPVRSLLQAEVSPIRGVRSGSFQGCPTTETRTTRSNSFQAADLFPPQGNQRSFHELGLPLVESPPARHRRWSSTPVDNPESLRVLWPRSRMEDIMPRYHFKMADMPSM